MSTLITLPYFPEEWLDWAWPSEPVFQYSEDAEWWVTDPNHPITEETIKIMPNLKGIVTASTGTNHLPLAFCQPHRLPVRSLLDARYELSEIKASSEFTFLLMLATLRNLKMGIRHANTWHMHERLFRGNELYGKKVGIIGLGRIGQNIYKWCKAFDAEITHIYDPHRVEGVKLEWLFDQCDIVVICCSLNPETRGMIDGQLLARLKNGACLVNTSRGEVIRESELVDVLHKRPDLRVGLDVLVGECSGMHLSSPLLDMNGVTATPHMAGTTVESQTKAAKIALALLRDLV